MSTYSELCEKDGIVCLGEVPHGKSRPDKARINNTRLLMLFDEGNGPCPKGFYDRCLQ